MIPWKINAQGLILKTLLNSMISKIRLYQYNSPAVK
jgi:hypothetical protein